MCFIVVIAYQMFVRNQRKENKMRQTCGTGRGGQKYVQAVGWKPNGNKSFGRHRCRWADNIKMYLERMGWESVDWIRLA